MTHDEFIKVALDATLKVLDDHRSQYKTIDEQILSLIREIDYYANHLKKLHETLKDLYEYKELLKEKITRFENKRTLYDNPANN